MRKTQKGFTLVELLVVIGILAVLTAVVLVAVNPVRQFAQARDTQRRADVTTLSAAIVAYLADPNNTNQRDLAGLGITATCTVDDGTGNMIPNPAVHEIGTGVGMLNLTSTRTDGLGPLTPTYVAAVPKDPLLGTTDDSSGYMVCVQDTTSNRFTVGAIHASEVDAAVTISVTR